VADGYDTPSNTGTRVQFPNESLRGENHQRKEGVNESDIASNKQESIVRLPCAGDPPLRSTADNGDNLFVHGEDDPTREH